ncbi:30S ribosomal protein S5 [Candidatus Pacearchaeota archaeon]|nr:30S ribosomal protein S5 [Candidatus Pacearchaeota archaeon]
MGESIEVEQVKEKRLTKEQRKILLEAEAGKKALDAWVPKTKLGRAVKEGKVKNIEEVFANDRKILEAEIVDSLLHLESDLLLIGQAKGKFGGGKRRAWRQTQKKTMEGNVVTFSCMAVVGDKKGHIGVGYGKAKETLPARAKALRNAKLNVIKITRGYETPEEDKTEPHTVPFFVEGKCGSIRIRLIPAPRGTGLVVGDECKKILRLAGIQDVYAVTKGQTRTTFNVAKACIEALKKTNEELLK